ncbi:MAG: polymer-forming cytoskeletal protein [bacterium]
MKKKLLMTCFAVLTLAPASQARWSSHSKNEIRHTAVVIAAGETFRGDMVTDNSVTVDGILEGDCVSLGGPVTITGRTTGDVVSMGGPVAISGIVNGDVISMGAPVEISGTVDGDISAIGANLLLKDTATVTGDISSLGGHIEKGDKVIFKGEINSVDLRILKRIAPHLLRLKGRDGVLAPLFIGGLLGLGLIMMTSVFLTGIILMILPAVFFPKNVEQTAAEITGNFWKCSGIGTLMIMAVFPAILFMAVSVLGIPLIPLALMLFFAAAILGMSGFSVVLEQRFFEGIKKTGPEALTGKVAMGYVLMAGLVIFGHVIPIVGGILSLAGFIITAFGIVLGLGAVWTTRMGTVERKKPVMPVQASPTNAPPKQ